MQRGLHLGKNFVFAFKIGFDTVSLEAEPAPEVSVTHLGRHQSRIEDSHFTL